MRMRLLGVLVAVLALTSTVMGAPLLPTPPGAPGPAVPSWWVADTANFEALPTHLQYHDLSNNPNNLKNALPSGGDYTAKNWVDGDPNYNFVFSGTPAFGAAIPGALPPAGWGDGVGVLFPTLDTMFKTMDNVPIASYNKEVFIQVVWHPEKEAGFIQNPINLRIFVPDGMDGQMEVFGLNVTVLGGEVATEHYRLQTWTGTLRDGQGNPIPQPAWETFQFINPNFGSEQGIFIDSMWIGTHCPEPATMALVVAGGLLCGAVRRRMRGAKKEA